MKTIFEKNGGTYEIQGNYLLQNLTLQEDKQYLIGVWNEAQTLFEQTMKSLA